MRDLQGTPQIFTCLLGCLPNLETSVNRAYDRWLFTQPNWLSCYIEEHATQHSHRVGAITSNIKKSSAADDHFSLLETQHMLDIHALRSWCIIISLTRPSLSLAFHRTTSSYLYAQTHLPDSWAMRTVTQAAPPRWKSIVSSLLHRSLREEKHRT